MPTKIINDFHLTMCMVSTGLTTQKYERVKTIFAFIQTIVFTGLTTQKYKSGLKLSLLLFKQL